MVGILVGEADVGSGFCCGLQARGEGDQRASCAGAEVENLMVVEVIEQGTEARDDGIV